MDQQANKWRRGRGPRLARRVVGCIIAGSLAAGLGGCAVPLSSERMELSPPAMRYAVSAPLAGAASERAEAATPPASPSLAPTRRLP